MRLARYSAFVENFARENDFRPSYQMLSSGASRPMAMISMSVLPVKAPVECSMIGDVVGGRQTSVFVNDNFDVIHAI
jgi:hypothetical protein